jgi:hypothetical protein
LMWTLPPTRLALIRVPPPGMGSPGRAIALILAPE